jgi:hypothetical protein
MLPHPFTVYHLPLTVLYRYAQWRYALGEVMLDFALRIHQNVI